jgi:hypothetical protein
MAFVFGISSTFLSRGNFTMSINMRQLLSANVPEGEKVRLLVIGSAEGVTEVIHALHHLGYAEVGAWSRILPIPDEGAFMSILTRHRRQD